MERFGGSFERIAKFDDAVDGDAITAKLESGLLTIVIPKVPMAEDNGHAERDKDANNKDIDIGNATSKDSNNAFPGNSDIALHVRNHDDGEDWQMEPGSPESDATVLASAEP